MLEFFRLPKTSVYANLETSGPVNRRRRLPGLNAVIRAVTKAALRQDSRLRWWAFSMA